MSANDATMNTKSSPAYRRVLLKLSGEALMGDDAFGINRATVEAMVADLGEVVRLGVEVAVVIGGGNIFRGVALGAGGMDRATADYMGMMATVMNAMALQDALRRAGVDARVQSALNIEAVVEPYIRPKALRYLEEGKIVIFAAGTGNPFFTTDTAAALRGSEIGAQIVLKATKVDGVYSADPKKDSKATRYSTITFDEAINRKLEIMDATAFALCRDQNLPIKVFNIAKRGRVEACGAGRRRRHAGSCLDARSEPMSIADIQKSTEQKMQKSVEALKHDYAKVRTGRAHIGLLDHIQVDYYGSMMPLNQVAQVGLGDARTITIQPWEKKMIPVVEKAIRDSDLGLNPATSGDVVRVPMPPLTEQRRKELVKVVKHEGENAKVAVRNLRREANHHVKEMLKNKEISEDDDRRAEDAIQKLTDRYVAEIDKLGAEKEHEVMTV